MTRRVFLISKENPAFELEIIEFDKEREKATVRGRHGDYEVDWPGSEEVSRKRKLNYRLEVRDA